MRKEITTTMTKAVDEKKNTITLDLNIINFDVKIPFSGFLALSLRQDYAFDLCLFRRITNQIALLMLAIGKEQKLCTPSF